MRKLHSYIIQSLFLWGLIFSLNAKDLPNVLFIAIDDMNDWTTLFDPSNPIQTPNLQRLAARGTFFNKAYCVSPACNPSRTAILTGLHPSTTGVYGNKDSWRTLVPDAVTLPQYFTENGYSTQGAGKIFGTPGYGIDTGVAHHVRQMKNCFRHFGTD